MERVAIYNRCSTAEENQKNALAIQAEESLELALQLGWEVVGQYVESQSGTSVDHRIEYQRMMEDLEADKFDIIMIKSIDRLARNTKDWYLFLDCIMRRGVRLYMYLERKFYVSDDALVSGIKAILAEQFSKELSQKIKNAHKRRQEKGLGLNITRPMYGWNKVAKDCYEINEKEAMYIRKAFELVEEGYGYRRISNELYDLGARNRNQQRISETQWRNLLRSPRMHGTVILNTTTYDFERKKKIPVEKEQWIYIDHALPEIVNAKYHEKILEILHRRSVGENEGKGEQRGRNQEQYKLSHKIFCGSCGTVYYRTARFSGEKKQVCWKCSNYLKMGKKKASGNGCDNLKLQEEQLYAILGELYQQLHRFSNRDEAAMMEKFFEILSCALENRDIERDIRQTEKQLRNLTEKEEVLLEKLLLGVIQDQQFSVYSKKLELDKENLQKTKENLSKQLQQEKDGENRLLKIRQEAEQGKLWQRAIRELAVEQVEQIYVYENQLLQIKWKGKDEIFSVAYKSKDKREEEKNKKRNMVYQCLLDNPYIRVCEIMDKLHMTESSVYSCIKVLKQEHAICYKREGKRGIWVVPNNGSRDE